ncbi:MAG: carbonic anhydrase family protein, partial [Myxococcota bacterium]
MDRQHVTRWMWVWGGVMMVWVSGCATPSPSPTEVASEAPKETTALHTAQPKAPHWGYEGMDGPQRWGELTQAFATCSMGMQQSPIDLADVRSAEPEALRFEYTPTNLDIVNNGHTIQVNYDNGSDIVVGDELYRLRQFHFHHPSEHTINGKHYPMEIHFVHVNSEGNFAVVALLVEEGDENMEFTSTWQHLPERAGDANHFGSITIDASKVLPTNRHYDAYAGSLTTPPCTEGVRWFVMTEPIQMSTAQIKHCDAIVPHNNR